MSIPTRFPKIHSNSLSLGGELKLHDSGPGIGRGGLGAARADLMNIFKFIPRELKFATATR